MALIGNQIRQYSDRVVLDSLTASATADYTLQLNSTDFVPSSAESLTVSLNGIIQKPQDSYTVSGSTLTFDSALTASDSIDFIIAERGITLQTPSAGSVNTEQLANNAVTYDKSTGFGKVGQVVQTVKTSFFSTSSTSYVDVTGLSVTITPSSTSSKILVSVSGASSGGATNSFAYGILLRDSTQIAVGDTRGSSQRATFDLSQQQAGTPTIWCKHWSISYLDEPSTSSATTYKLQVKKTAEDIGIGGTFDSGDGNRSSVPTIITAMEILN